MVMKLQFAQNGGKLFISEAISSSGSFSFCRVNFLVLCLLENEKQFMRETSSGAGTGPAIVP
jgi:hypothetical protein